jgi:hypothetical protein
MTPGDFIIILLPSTSLVAVSTRAVNLMPLASDRRRVLARLGMRAITAAIKVGRLSRDSGRYLVGPVPRTVRNGQRRFAPAQEFAGEFVDFLDTASALPLASIGPVYWNGTEPAAFEFRVREGRDHDSMPQQLLFELNGARVTPHIATFEGTSYQIANIGSVHVVRRRKYNPFAIIIFLLGLGILVAAIIKFRVTGLAEEYFSTAATAVVLMVASALLQLIWPRRVYVLVLRTSSGDVDAVTSRNKEFVSNVQKAVEQAFVVRAAQPPASET